MEIFARIADAIRPLTDKAVALWRSEPVLVIAGALIVGRAGLTAAQSGLDAAAVVDAVIAAAAAFLARASVFSPATVDALTEVAEG